MRFRNLTGDDRIVAGGIGLVLGYEVDAKGDLTDKRGEFDLPDGFPLASIAHQDIFEPADAEAKTAVAALLKAESAGASVEPAQPPTPAPVVVPQATTEQEK